MTWWSEQAVSAPAEEVWRLLVDLDEWPRWGPSVSSARLEDGSRALTAGAKGAVRTPVGLWLPFEVTSFAAPDAHPDVSADGDDADDADDADDPIVAHWSWAVAGTPATTHRVRRRHGGCQVELGAPWWAPAYLPVLAVGTRRLAALADGAR